MVESLPWMPEASPAKFLASGYAAISDGVSNAQQRIVDSLSQAQGTVDILPKALHVVAQTVGAETSAYFEITERKIVRLKFWLLGETALTGADLQSHNIYGNHETPRILSEGFEVPEDYFETPGMRERASVIDHRRGTPKPDFDDWLIEHGWPIELNVPILMRGRDAGAFCLLRGKDRPFSLADIVIAEALAKHLALVHEVARVCETERDAVVAPTLLHEASFGGGANQDSLDPYLHEFGRKSIELVDRLLDNGRAQELSVRVLSKASGYSVGHFTTLFRRVLGVSPAKYIALRKLERAKVLLAEGNSATWVANECGFCDHAHLSRRFNEVFGVRPSQLARSLK